MYWWENTFLKVAGNRLEVAGRAAEDLAEEFGTPLFVYSRDRILDNLARLRRAFESDRGTETRICYAMKANYHPEILSLLNRRGLWIDAVSPGEVGRALDAGFPPERIIYTGTSVSGEDLDQVARYPDVILNVDAEDQMDLMIGRLASSRMSSRQRISLRWNPGLGRGFSPKTVTAGSRSSDGTPIKFGIEESRILPVLEKALEAGFSPIGLHQHLGSGWIREDLSFVKEAVDRMVSLASRLVDRGLRLEFLDFGGGFGPIYYREQPPFPLEEYAACIHSTLEKRGLALPAIAVEPGKYLVGDAGILLLRVEYLKSSYGNRFACVNGGTFNTVPRPAIYTQAQHAIVNTACVRSEDMPAFTIAGNLCETGDVFAKEVPMPPPERGGILALLCAGAYCRSMASNFNCRKIPPEILV
jgi:diaminopimelate decarboxylase